MKHFLGIVAFICLSIPLHAQWARGLQGLFTRATTQQALSSAVERKVVSSVAAKQYIPLELQNSVFTVKENNLFYRYLNDHIHASAFVIAENYQGKTYLWGVSAAHYHFVNPALEETPNGHSKNITIAAKGNDKSSDIFLFPIPDKWADRVKPLALAEDLPKPGEILHSIGFFQNRFQYEANRMVYEISPYSMTTKIADFPKELHYRRVGACGGPILNAKNEVVGVHNGSSSGASVGYAVPVTQLRRLLNAYHTGQDKKPIIIEKTQVGTLDVTENLEYIEIWHKNKLQHVIPFSKGTNYDNLDAYSFPNSMDKIRLVLRRTPLSNKGKEHRFVLTYDFTTKQLTYEQNDKYWPPSTEEHL